jgi:hypothetical protein
MWPLEQSYVRRLKMAQMKFIRRRVGYKFLYQRSTEYILEELKLDSVEKKLAQFKQKG